MEMNTIAELFHRFIESGLRWAVLRNYERLPLLDLGGKRLTDLDLVVHHDDMDRFRTILSQVSEECGWDASTECDHYAQSPAPHHRIEVFRFYRAAPLEFLQVDVFHASVVSALSLLDESQMLEDRCFDASRGLFRLDPAKENLYRIVQIAAEMRAGRNPAKVERYARRLKAFAWQWPGEISGAARRYFSPFAAAAVRNLCHGDTRGFLRNVRLARGHFILRALLRRPLETIRCALVRRAENRLRFHVRPCGGVVRVSAESPEQRDIFAEVLDTLARQRIVYDWRVTTREPGRLDAGERTVLERGGMLIRWAPAPSSKEEADIRVDRYADADSIARQVLALLVRRHRLLHGSESALRSAEATLA